MTETNLPGHDDVRAIVHREVNNLPDDLRAALAMRYFSEATHEEIADILDIPLGTVSWRIHEGLTRLQKRFAGLGLAAVVPLLEQHLAVMARHILVSAELELKVAKIVATARVLESGGMFSSKPPVKTNVPAGVLGIAGAVIVFLLGAGMFFLLFDNPVPSQRIERGDQKAERSPSDVGKNDRLFPVNSREGSSTASGAKNAQSAEGPAVAGVVGDEDGQPVGDAILRLYPVSLTDDGGDSYGFSFGGNEVAHTISQPTGEYQFTAIAFKQAYEIVAQKEGYLPTSKIFYIDEQKNRRVDIIVRKGCRVTGRVVNRKGDPCPDAVVAQGTYDAPEPNRLAKTNMEEISTIYRRASNTTGRFFHRYRQNITLTDKEGRYAFIAAVGPFGVGLVETEMSTLQHGGMISIFRHPPEFISDWTSRTSKESLYRFLGMRQEMSKELVGVEDYHTLSVNGDCSIPDIVVAKGLFLEGRVVDHQGEPVAGATVGAIGGGIKKVGWEVTGDGSKVQEIRRFPEYGRTMSDERGHFMIGGLLPGRYYLKASHEEKDSAGYQVVDLTARLWAQSQNSKCKLQN